MPENPICKTDCPKNAPNVFAPSYNTSPPASSGACIRRFLRRELGLDRKLRSTICFNPFFGQANSLRDTSMQFSDCHNPTFRTFGALFGHPANARHPVAPWRLSTSSFRLNLQLPGGILQLPGGTLQLPGNARQLCCRVHLLPRCVRRFPGYVLHASSRLPCGSGSASTAARLPTVENFTWLHNLDPSAGKDFCKLQTNVLQCRAKRNPSRRS